MSSDSTEFSQAMELGVGVDESNGITDVQIGSRGPPKTSAIWNFFYQKTEQDQLYSCCRICPYKNRGRNTTTLRSHLKNHSMKKAELSQQTRDKKKKRKKKKKKVLEKQQPRDDMAIDKREESKSKDLKKALTALAACSSMTLNMVEEEDFKNFVATLDPEAEKCLPSRDTLKIWVFDFMTEMKMKIQKDISDAKMVNVCVDLRSHPGLSPSSLGVTVHYYNSAEGQLKTAALACCHLPRPHTAGIIRNAVFSILREWDIPQARILTFVTSQGDQAASERHPRVTAIVAVNSSGNEDCTSSSEYDTLDDLNNAVCAVFPHRLPCFAHVLNCTFEAVLEKSSSPIYSLCEKVLSLVCRFAESTAASECLGELTGTKALNGSKSWHSFFPLIDRIVELRPAVEATCVEENWHVPFDWGDAELSRDFLKPLVETIAGMLEGTHTLSQILPAILTVREHALDTDKRFDRLDGVASDLLRELDRRFGHVMDQSHEHFDPTLLISCMLDPSKTAELTDELFATGKSEVQRFSSSQVAKDTLEDGLENESASENTHGTKRRKVDQHTSVQTLTDDVLSGQVEEYLRAAEHGAFELGIDSITYWQQNSSKFDKLAPLALAMLSIPGTSASAQWLSSLGGEVADTGGRSEEMSQADAFARYNRSFMTC